jgi:DNA repair photolyase
MNDPYMPLEGQRKLTRQALEVVSDFNFPVHIITKSDLVVRDIDLLQKIGKTCCAISITITTSDDDLAAKIEPGAPTPSRRLAAIQTLSAAGILTGITLMPVLPFIEDNETNIESLVKAAAQYGAKYIIASFGMSMRDRQREWYYHCLEQSFPGLRQKYTNIYGDKYNCPVPNAHRLEYFFNQLCTKYKIDRKMPVYNQQNPVTQPGLF